VGGVGVCDHRVHAPIQSCAYTYTHVVTYCNPEGIFKRMRKGSGVNKARASQETRSDECSNLKQLLPISGMARDKSHVSFKMGASIRLQSFDAAAAPVFDDSTYLMFEAVR